MSLGEFELIETFLSRLGEQRDDIVLGVGDDAALLRPPPGLELACAADTIVEGVHFPADLSAEDVGHRVLAVNLSDMAAMGAEPAWALLALTMPRADQAWLRRFAHGLHGLAREHGTAVVGGDMSAGPLSATLTILGFVPAGQALRRAGARAGDEVWVSGTPGDAAAGLAALSGALEAPPRVIAPLVERFCRPRPRVALGLLLRGIASACIDVSDGLAADLGKLCSASRVGASLDSTCLPLSAAMRGAADPVKARRWALAGGDDYELLFTVPPGTDCVSLGRSAGVDLTRIGVIESGAGVRIDGEPAAAELGHGFDHFAGTPRDPG